MFQTKPSSDDDPEVPHGFVGKASLSLTQSPSGLVGSPTPQCESAISRQMLPDLRASLYTLLTSHTHTHTQKKKKKKKKVSKKRKKKD